jgi:hypothetical protein
VDGPPQDELLGLARNLDQGADLARMMAIMAGTGSETEAARAAAQ